MAQFFTDFSEITSASDAYSDNSLSEDTFTIAGQPDAEAKGGIRYGFDLVESNKTLFANLEALTFTPNQTVVDIYVETPANTNVFEKEAGIFLGLANGNAIYFSTFQTRTGRTAVIGEKTPTEASVLANEPLSNASSNVTDKLRFQFNSSNNIIRAKWWADSNPEPSSWNLSTTYSANTTITKAGLFMISFSTNQLGFAYVSDVFGIGTNGDPAPTGSVATGPATPTNLGVENLAATSARLTWEQG